MIKFLESDRASKCITPKRYGRKTQVTLETATLGGWLCGIGADSGLQRCAPGLERRSPHLRRWRGGAFLRRNLAWPNQSRLVRCRCPGLPTTRVIQLPRPGEHSGSVAQSNSLDCGSGDRSGFCQNAAHTTPLRYRPGRYAIDRLNLVLRLVRAGAVGRFVQSRPRCFSARLRSSAC